MIQLAPDAPRVPGWVSRQVFAVAVVVATLVFLPVGVRPRVSHRDSREDRRPPGTTLLYAESIEANAATAEDFESLPGIGPAKAKRVIAARDSRKGFCETEEVRRAAGLGARAWEAAAPLIRVKRSPRCSSFSRE